MPPLVSGKGLCYIDRVQLGVPQKNLKKIENPDTAELDRFFVKWKNSNYRSNFAVSGLSIFLNFSQVLLNILYRYNIVPARLLVEAHEILKSLNLPYAWVSIDSIL